MQAQALFKFIHSFRPDKVFIHRCGFPPGKIMECPQCGKETSEDRAYCSWCGSSLPRPEKMLTETPGTAAATNGASGRPKCYSCGRQGASGDRFCSNCGNRIDENAPCPGCGAKVPRSSRFCQGCGREINPGMARKKSDRPIAALLLGLVPGLMSIWGIGHFFSGQANAGKKGAFFLIIGLVMAFVSPIGIWSMTYVGGGAEILLAIVLVAVWVGIWLYQAVDAYWCAGGD